MVQFKDPVTDVSYDLMDPVGTAKKAGMIVGGMAVTLLLFTAARDQVMPSFSSWINSLTGVSPSGNDNDMFGSVE